MSLSTLEIYYASLRDLKRQREETESTMKKGDVIALKRLQMLTEDIDDLCESISCIETWSH